MKKVYYRKLIRDLIPAKMDRVGVAHETRKLGKHEFEKELLKKVGEETSGLETAKNKKEIIEELADVLDVVEEVIKHWKIKPSCLREKQKENARKKGSFKKRIFLVWSEDDGYKTNERRYRR